MGDAERLAKATSLRTEKMMGPHFAAKVIQIIVYHAYFHSL